jgi:hypothetical protein
MGIHRSTMDIRELDLGAQSQNQENGNTTEYNEIAKGSK